MYFNKSFYSIALLLLLLLSTSCSTKPANSNAHSVESQIGVFSLDATRSYAEKLDPEVIKGLMDFLKSTSVHRLLIEKKGIDPNNSNLSSEQKEAIDTLNLIFIDLYRVIYEAIESVLSKVFDAEQKKGNNKGGLTKEQYVADNSLYFIQGVFSSIECPSLHPKSPIKEHELLTTSLIESVQKYYINSYTQYLDSGELDTLQNAVGVGRKQVSQILAECAKSEPAYN